MKRTPRFVLAFTAAFLCWPGAARVSAVDSPALSLARQLNDAFIEVADKVSPSVVVIEVTEKPRAADAAGSFWDLLPPEDRPRHHHHQQPQEEEPLEGEGSGIVITADGYILTNNHVVDNADKIVVRFKNGRTYDGEVKGVDPQSDIAVIKIKAAGLTAAKLGDSDKTRVGEFVLAIGAPFALSYSVTFGHISAKGRSFERTADQDFIQTDASINPGNSGGPLVNLYGEVIAINTMIEGMNTGIGFAVPINLAKRVKDHLMTEGKFTRSWLGIGIDELRGSSDFRSMVNPFDEKVSDGVIVMQIFAGSPASHSELHTGDVITAVEGKPVATARELKDAVSTESPGHLLALQVVRGIRHLTLSVRTEALPVVASAPEEPAAPAAPEQSALGLTVHGLSRDMAERYGVAVNNGVIVTAVEQSSSAEEKGLQPGDIITEINRQKISTPQQFRHALAAAPAGKSIFLNVISDGSNRLVILTGVAP